MCKQSDKNEEKQGVPTEPQTDSIEAYAVGYPQDVPYLYSEL
jgi:hypothetical protein